MKSVFTAICLSISFSFISTAIFAQMPQWKYFKDRAGNIYYYDMAHKIRVDSSTAFEYVSVSLKGIDYHYNRAVSLVKNHKVEESIYLLKSILALKSNNNRIRKIQIKSAKLLGKLRKNHGNRFDILNMENCLLINQTVKNYTVVNDNLKYSFSSMNRPLLLKKRWKYRGSGHSVKFGFGKKQKGGYDYLLGVEGRIYRFKLRDIDAAVNSWLIEMGLDSLIREEISRGDDFLINSFSYGKSAPFSGVEAYFISGKRFFYVRIMCHDSLKSRLMDEMKRIIISFRVIK